MNKLVYSAIALTVVSASAFATDNGWVSLDQEINNLNASLSAQNASGPKVGGYVRSRWESSSDVQVPDDFNAENHDLSGFSLDNVRVEVSGDAGSDYAYKVSFDLASGTAALRDAYVQFKIGDSVMGKMGQFKANFLHTASVGDDKLVLLDRTVLGGIPTWNSREPGVELGFSYDTINVTVSGQNGTDGAGKEYELVAKVSANLMGGGVGKVEGAYGAGDATALTAGVSYLNDSNVDKSSTIGVEALLTSGPFSIAGEVVIFDKNGVGYVDAGTPVTFFADASPWDVTGSYLFSDMWEGAVRYEDLDDADNTSLMTLGVNYFVSGHDIKWTAQYQKLTTDNASGDVSIVALGLNLTL